MEISKFCKRFQMYEKTYTGLYADNYCQKYIATDS